MTPVDYQTIVGWAWEEARRYIDYGLKSDEGKRAYSRFREYCDKARLNHRSVLTEVRQDLRDERLGIHLGNLYKDTQGRRCWLVARNPGRDAGFFVEGRCADYHWVVEKDVPKLYTRYVPPLLDEAPLWWQQYHTGIAFIRGKMVRVKPSTASWNGWYSAEINHRFYILSSTTIHQKLRESLPYGGPHRKTDRAAFLDDLV